MTFEVTLPCRLMRGGKRTVTVTLQAGASGLALPSFLVQSEFAFLIALLRRATKEEIRPLSMMLREVPESSALAEFAGAIPQAGPVDAIVFAEASLQQPFVSRNEAMWSYFEPELSRRLADLAVDSSISARVRSALTELLPSGIIGIEAVAEKLGLSRRTLQRKLAEEGTTFQAAQQHARGPRAPLRPPYGDDLERHRLPARLRRTQLLPACLQDLDGPYHQRIPPPAARRQCMTSSLLCYALHV